MMNKQGYYYIVIIFFAICVFFNNNHFLRGHLECQECLGKEIQSPPDSLYQYKLIQKAPFKYRVLFPAIVRSSYEIVFHKYDSKGFYYAYKTWSLIFIVVAACLFFYLLQLNNFSNSLSLLGVSIFLLLPPLLMAYTLPVHTREDPLAYCILLLGLIFIQSSNSWLFFLIALIGPLCRETLLILPFLYFFFGNDNVQWRRYLITGLPVVLWISLRVLIEKTPYDSLEGFHWNNKNPEQVVGFLFITYNILWVPFLLFIIKYKSIVKNENNRMRSFIFRSSFAAIGLILVTTYLGGIYNEIRLLYLAVPWMVIIFLNFIESFKKDLVRVLVSYKYLAYIIFCTLVGVFLVFLLLKYQEVLIKPGKYNIPYDVWIISSWIYIVITIILFPAFIKVFINANEHNKNIPASNS